MKVPVGCLDDLSGAWVHRDDPTFQYLGTDDGGSLTLAAYRVWPTDAGSSDAEQLPSATMVLTRTADGFAGEAVASAAHPSGKSCEVRFATRITDCSDGGLTLQSASAVAMSDTCETPQKPRSPAMLEHRLARADAGFAVLR